MRPGVVKGEVLFATNHPYPSLTKEGSLKIENSPPILGGVAEGQGGT
jgi:hypothetical protein